MAAGSDLLDNVFLSPEVDKKVVSDVVGCQETEVAEEAQVDFTEKGQSAANQVGNSAVDSCSNVPSSKMGLSQQELPKTGPGGKGCVSDSTGSQGTASPAGLSCGAQSQPKPTAVSEAASGVVKPGATSAQTFNGSSVAVKCHVPKDASGGGSSTSQPAVADVNNGPVSADVPAAPTATCPQKVSSCPVISSQSTGSSVPTVTLTRPPVHTSAVSTAQAVGVTRAPDHPVSRAEPLKTVTVTPTGPSVTPGTAATGRSATVLQTVRTSLPSTVAVTSPAGIRTTAPQTLAPRPTLLQQKSPNIQLPKDMVLVRSESGQLLMIHQQTLYQMQAGQLQLQSTVTPRPAAPTNIVQIAPPQTPGSSLLARPVTPATILKQVSTVQTSATPTTTLQRPPMPQRTIVLGGTAPTSGQPTVVQPGSAATAVTQRVGPPGAAAGPLAPIAVTAETLENVKKCRNFLSTLIKLASAGKQSSETTAKVKELVKSLLESKIEAEEFTSRLYQELNSSPQPHLVPFLKRSLPALRQMTPDSESFIHQSLLPQPSAQPAAAASTALTAVVLRPPLSSTGSAATKTTVISLAQTPRHKAALIVPQQHGTVIRPQVTITPSPVVTVRSQPHSRIFVGQVPVVKQLSAVNPALSVGAKGVQVVSHTPLTDAQKLKLKEAAGATFRDDDDINDVASMAGVNLSEESARILATNSDLVGAVTRSCKDEAFLSTSPLTQRALEIGKKFGVRELGTDVINYISHAAQHRLQNLLERVSHVAQQKHAAFKEDERHEQAGDVRAQLRFFEQLDQMEKQRKEEQEREILLKAAKSRSRQEDPEQLRLKQKAKEFLRPLIQMQQQELAQIRQREANLTALAAIGPRKKRKTDSPVRGSTAEVGAGSGPSQPGASSGGGSRQFMRQRITRVNLRDLLFCLENERGTSRSHLLYKGFLK